MTTEDARILAAEYRVWAAGTTGGEAARMARAAAVITDLANQLDSPVPNVNPPPPPAPVHVKAAKHTKADAK